MIAIALEELTRTLAAVDTAEFSALIELIRDHSAHAIHVSGQGRSGLVARMVAMRLMHIGIEAHAVGDATSPAIGTDDLLILISGSGSTPISAHFAGIAAEHGATVAVLTRRPDHASISNHASLVIRIPAEDSQQLGGNLFEHAALIVLDAAVAESAGDLSQARRTLAVRHSNLQ